MKISSWIARTPRYCSAISSIHIWKMSWLILSLNGTHRNLYLPKCVLNVVKSDAAFVRYILKNALLPSTLENLVAPVRTWAISSRVGALWFSLIMALFRSFGSRQILSLPFAFLGYVNELTHGVGSVCLVIIPCQTISASSFSSSALCSMGTLHLLCWTGRTVGSVLMLYSPAMSPMQSKLFGYNACRSLVLSIDVEPGSMSMGLNLDPFGGGPVKGCSFTCAAVLTVPGSEMTKPASFVGTIYLYWPCQWGSWKKSMIENVVALLTCLNCDLYLCCSEECHIWWWSLCRTQICFSAFYMMLCHWCSICGLGRNSWGWFLLLK